MTHLSDPQVLPGGPSRGPERAAEIERVTARLAGSDRTAGARAYGPATPLGRLLAVLVASLGVISLPTDVESAEFIPLGDLPGGNRFSQALAVSADGATVVGQSDSATGRQAFRWTPVGGMVPVYDFPGDSYSTASDVSADGQVIVGSFLVGLYLRAYRWSAAAGLEELRTGPTDSLTRHATAVSSDGEIVVGWRKVSAFDFEAFRWSESEGFTYLGTLPEFGYSSQATAVSANGEVVAGHSGLARPTSIAVRWITDDSLLIVGDLPDSNDFSQSYGISADGAVIVGRGNGTNGTEAFRWTQATGPVGLGVPPGWSKASIALAASGDGSVVVGSGNLTVEPEAFYWTQSAGMRSLEGMLAAQGTQVPGWTLSEASGVSADGLTVVGSGINPDGFIEGFIAILDSQD